MTAPPAESRLRATDTARYVFGPVPSRRLGRSLGVDLVPHKTCTYDCIYCQLGRTTNLTLDRGPYAPPADVLRELEDKLATRPAPDYITLSGSGEPTLHAGLGVLIRRIRLLTDRPVAVLTNGSLLWREDVQADLLEADLVMPSIDAGDDEMFQRVNRPHPQLRFEQVADGFVSFRRRFAGQLWLEVLLLGGLTATDDQTATIRELVRRIAPDRVQLNSATRPPSEPGVQPASADELARAAQVLGGGAEVIARRPPGELQKGGAPGPSEIVALLRRRPCTLEDLAAGLGVHRLEAAKHVEKLLRAGTIIARRHGERAYYQHVDCTV